MTRQFTKLVWIEDVHICPDCLPHSPVPFQNSTTSEVLAWVLLVFGPASLHCSSHICRLLVRPKKKRCTLASSIQKLCMHTTCCNPRQFRESGRWHMFRFWISRHFLVCVRACDATHSMTFHFQLAMQISGLCVMSNDMLCAPHRNFGIYVTANRFRPCYSQGNTFTEWPVK